MKRVGILAAKISLSLVLAAGVQPVFASGIPTVDVANIVQTTVSAQKNVAAVEKQIQQYQTQLQQYQNMLQNSMAPSAYIWDQASKTINKLRNAQSSLSNLTNTAGGIDQYLNRYQNVGYYRSSPCFQAGGCSAAQQQELTNQETENSASVQDTNADVIKTVTSQQQSLDQEASNLQQLQNQASGAEGQMAAISAGNQLASNQANQLMQIRGLLMAQASAQATKAQADADKEAKQTAADYEFRSGSYTTSPSRTW